MILSRKDFKDALSDVKAVFDFYDMVNHQMRKMGLDGSLCMPDCTDRVLMLLHTIFENTDGDDWISYFVFELDFGEKWKPGTLTEANGTDIKMQTMDDLYDLLTGSSDKETLQENG